VFVADPQLVDPHTYPGRPWPLDTLTEIYTDRYMSRNFRLINAELDPDSVVFLGDLFDGGREWAPSWGRPLSADEKVFLYNLGVVVKPRIPEVKNSHVKEGDFNPDLAKLQESWEIEARQSAQPVPPQDPRSYIHGEEGRWARWGSEQWVIEMERFAKIFYAPGQLYPRSSRSQSPAVKTWPSDIILDNGAWNTSRQELAILGHKQRKVVTNLPGNHDVGFGSGVQLSVRNRFEGVFGSGNDLYVLGNHTFLSLDTPSLSAYSEFTIRGETSKEERDEARYIWEPAYQYLDNLQNLSKPVINSAIAEMFPDAENVPGRTPQQIADARAASDALVKRQPSQTQLPVILLSHVPFYRDQGFDCGPLREKGRSIHVSAGYQYQNVLTKELTTHIVQRVSSSIGEIAHVFSGDDHDYCDVEFPYDIGSVSGEPSHFWPSVRDITVKSFSWAMGVRKPGFLLVSLWNPIDANGKSIRSTRQTIQSKSCLLPDQLGIFIQYASLLGFTLAVLLARAVFVASRGYSDQDDLVLSTLTSRSATKHSSSKSNGFSASQSSPLLHGRHRASSTSTSTNTSDPEKLSVQRSYNARTRSISPMPLGEAFTKIASIAKNAVSSQNLSPESHAVEYEKSRLSPQVRWDDAHSDLESQIDDVEHDQDEDYDDFDPIFSSSSGTSGTRDSQAKWKKRLRPKRKGGGKARRAIIEFGSSLVWVAVPSAVLYGWLIWSG
jgi:hypothetical protein